MNDDLTTRLSRQLHEQADDWHAAPLTLAGVQGRARSIRRRRHVLGSGVVAAALLAVAIPVGISISGQTDSAPGPTTPSPSRIVDTENPQPAPSVIGQPYLEGRLLTLPDGTELELPQRYEDAVVWGDQVLGVGATLDRLDDDLQVVEQIPLDSGITRNADGSAIAYSTGGELVIEWADGTMELGPIGDVELVRLLGGPDCSLGADDCVVYFNDGRTPMFRNNSGEEATVSGNVLHVQDAASGFLISVLTRVYERPEAGSCSEVRNAQAQETIFETCAHTLSRFSPGGAFISALPPYLSGIGSAWAAILDQDGDEVARFGPADGFVHSAVWEDSDNLLVTAYDFDTRAWSVVRLGVDGSTELALGPSTATDEMMPAYVVLGAR